MESGILERQFSQIVMEMHHFAGAAGHPAGPLGALRTAR